MALSSTKAVGNRLKRFQSSKYHYGLVRQILVQVSYLDLTCGPESCNLIFSPGPAKRGQNTCGAMATEH